MSTDPDCLFCRIVAGDIPAEVVRESEHTVAFRDLNPQAPTHVLVIPRRHEPDIGSLVAAAPDEAATLLSEARGVADQEGADDNYRLVFNTGADANQTVFHCHAHVLAGRSFTWPPG
ncbi:MAG TPA: histidine triad nucleotide-binding protein [Nocardioidaceae bacterium]|nr:histidine triad nucleotide-binding protein [Nocardioidaceae bacterium]